MVLQEVPVLVGQSLSEVALATQTDYAELQKYNKWLSGSVVPGHKPYTVLVPIINPNQQQAILAANRQLPPAGAPGPVNTTPAAGKTIITTINGLKATVAQRGDTKDKLARAGKLSAKRFMQYNDITHHAAVVAGQTYYFERKPSRATTAHYTAQAGEQTWHVAQKLGIKLKSVLWYNRLKKDEKLLAGRVLWLQQRRPSHRPVEYEKTPPTETAPPAKPLVIARAEPVPASVPRNYPAPAPVVKPATKNTVEDKLADVFGVKPTPEKVTQVETKPAEVDENLTEVNEEFAASEPLATSPVIPNAPSTPEFDSTAFVVIAPGNESDEPAVAGIDTTLSPVETEEITAPANAGQNTAGIYTSRQPTPAPATGASVPVQKATAPPQEPTVENTGNSVSVTITEHVVSKGETLYSISRLYGLPVAQLRAWNSLNDLPIAIGQPLRLTPPAGAPTADIPVASSKPVITAAAMPAVTERAATANTVTTQHVVTAGESMYQISRKYGVTIKDLMEWNRKADFSVSPGEKLTIKPKSSSRN